MKIDASRYNRASAQTAPKRAACTAGAAIEGYWLNEHEFYCIREQFDAESNSIVDVPSIADVRSQSVREVISMPVLWDRLSAKSGRQISSGAQARASFDMRDSHALCVSVDGWEFELDLREEPCVTLMRPSVAEPALYSPDGRHACFVRDNDVWLRDLNTGSTQALTHTGAPNNAYGRRSETGLSAVSYRARPQILGQWSADSQWFLTHRTDERLVPELALVRHAPANERPQLNRFRYSMPGDPLPQAIYVAINVSSGEVIEFTDFPVPVTSAYAPFARTAWLDEHSNAWVLRFDRYCRRVELIKLDPVGREGRVLITEIAPTGYVEVNPFMGLAPLIRVLRHSNELIWYSDRDGWGHLYLYDASSAALKNQITRGEWLVTDIVHVDEAKRSVLFLAGGLGPATDRVMCTINLDGTGFRVLFAHDGDVHLSTFWPAGVGQTRPFRKADLLPSISPTGRHAVVRCTNVISGDETKIIDLDTGAPFEIAALRPSAGEIAPHCFSVLAADGETALHGVMFFPSDFNRERSYPVIDYIYPGPQVVHRPRSYQSSLSSQARALAELGFVTIMLDTRRSAFGSRDFQQIGYGGMLEPQLADHAAAVRELCRRHSYLDADRIGMIGASGGGLATAQALFDYAEVYRAGVAVCGNYDPRFYTAPWSEKYCGPDADLARQPAGVSAHKLQGALFLVSGEMDENVHVAHTLGLADALVKANKDFELLLVPNAGHGILSESAYLQRRIWDFFVRHLLETIPPREFALTYSDTDMLRLSKSSAREFN